MRRAVIFGASGLVGKELLRLLLAEETYTEVISFGRSKLAIQHPRLDTRAVDFLLLDECRDSLQDADVFCCLGTTMKKAGSRDAFRQVDYDYPLEIARMCKEAGARQFLIITALGSDSRSTFFYNRVKGELEEALLKLQLPSSHVFRPSLLLGNRQEYRRGEKLGAWLSRFLSPLWIGPLRPYRPIAASDVAKAMLWVALEKQPDHHVHVSKELTRLAAIGKQTS